MAQPVRIGNLVESADAERSAASGTESISVPADAEFMVVGVSGYCDDATDGPGYFSGGAVTIGGQAMTAVTGGDASTSGYQGTLFYKVSPPTGTQTLSWNWKGTAAPASEGGVIIVYGFYKGTNVADAVADSDGSQDANHPYDTKTFAAVTDGLIIAWCHAYHGGSETFTWTNATEISAFDAVSGYREAIASWAEGTAGNVSIRAEVTQSVDGGITAIVLKPAGGGGGKASKNTHTKSLGMNLGTRGLG